MFRNRAWFWGIILVALLTVSAIGTMEMTRCRAQNIYMAARTAAQRRDWQLARSRLAEARTLAPRNALYWGGEGYSCAVLSGVASIPSVATPLTPDFATTSSIWCAIECYKTATKLQPMDAAFHNNLGWLLWETGSRSEGMAELAKAVELEPMDVTYRVAIGLVQEMGGDIQSALESYSYATAYAPSLLDSEFFGQLKRLPLS